MKKLILIFALLSAPVFAAQMQAIVPSGAMVTLFDTPCKNAMVLEQIKPDYHTMFQAGRVTWSGGERQLCWTIHNGDVIVVDDAGVQAELPILLFAPKGGI